MTSLTDAANQATEVCSQIRPLLAGRGPEIQGAVLAELVAMWLAGFSVNGEAVVEQILQGHIRAVRVLLPGETQRIRSRFVEP